MRRPRSAGFTLPAFLSILPTLVLVLAIVSALVASFPAGASATTTAEEAGLPGPLYCTRIYLDGQRIVLPVPAVLADGHTMVPARAVFERLGATVLWDGVNRVTIKTADRTIDLWLGFDLATVDGELCRLEAPPVLWRSHVMVPLRFLAEKMGLGLSWDDPRRAVLLSTSPAGAAAPIRDVTLAFAGDSLFDLWIGDLIRTKGADYPWGGVGPTLSAADIAMVNLECSVSTRGTPCDKTWTFRADPECLDGLVNAGVDIVSTANNHTGDFGTDALLDTLSYLDEHGLARVGAGANKEEAWRPVVLEAEGYKIGFMAATIIYPDDWAATAQRPGICSARDVKALAAAVAELHKQVDYVVVNVHWGNERDTNPTAFERECGPALVDAGADLVIGHHPHILQGIAAYKGGVIAYSLGNFIFTRTTRASQDSGIVVATFDEQGLAAVRFLPAFTDAGRPVLETGEDYDRILADLNTLSAEWNTALDPCGYVMLP